MLLDRHWRVASKIERPLPVRSSITDRNATQGAVDGPGWRWDTLGKQGVWVASVTASLVVDCRGEEENQSLRQENDDDYDCSSFHVTPTPCIILS